MGGPGKTFSFHFSHPPEKSWIPVGKVGIPIGITEDPTWIPQESDGIPWNFIKKPWNPIGFPGDPRGSPRNPEEFPEESMKMCFHGPLETLVGHPPMDFENKHPALGNFHHWNPMNPSSSLFGL